MVWQRSCEVLPVVDYTAGMSYRSMRAALDVAWPWLFLFFGALAVLFHHLGGAPCP